ncbi:hypothetical protein BDW75DRAFT_216143 [Aspergillus navahoensis]
MSVLSGYPVESCFSCRTKKRKCDRQLPVCSRCKQVGQQCLYGSWAYGAYGCVVPISNSEILRLRSDPSSTPLVSRALPRHISKACSFCQRKKKSCDRSYPRCGRCQRVNATCTYEGLDRLRILESQHYFSPDLPLQAVEYKPGYPIKSKPYFQELIKFFQYRIALSCLEVDTGSLAYHLQSTWINYALTDPCLFHATLYLASAQLERLRQSTSKVGPITIYHHMNAIQLLNSRIGSGLQPDDPTIAAVLLLALSGSFEQDNTAAEAHGQGLLRMVEMRGGLENLGFKGILAQLIQMNTVFPATVFDRLDAFAAHSWDTRAPPIGLPRLALDRLQTCPSKKGSPVVRSYLVSMFKRIYELLLAVDRNEKRTAAPAHALRHLQSILNKEWTPTTFLPDDISKSERAILRACSGTVLILQCLLNASVLVHPGELDRLRRELKTDLDQTDPPTWLRYTPEANLWVINIGMALSDAINGRFSFLLDKQCIVMAIRATDTALHEKFWCCYRWFRVLVQARLARRDWTSV